MLLGSMLCYDVFWVFLQPRLTHSSSVMVEVHFLQLRPLPARSTLNRIANVVE